MLMDISFSCDCGEQVETSVYVPDPDFSAEKNRDSAVEHWEEVLCENCGKEHEAMVVNTFFAADCYIDNGDTEVNYGMPYYPEDEAEELYWYVESKSQYGVLQNHLKSVRTLLDADVPEETLFSLWVMLHGHVVSAVEGYLAGTFIHKVTNSEELIRKLVETDPEFSKRTFTLKEIFEKQSNLKLTVATYLKDLIFHDLKKVKPMFKDVLGHDFGNISWLFKDVVKRHDCVHRAGYNKDGVAIDVSKETLLLLLDNVHDLVESVEKSVNQLEEPNDLPF